MRGRYRNDRRFPGTFAVAEQSDPTGPYITVSNYFCAVPASLGQTLTSLTGIFMQFSGYEFTPRSASDVGE